MLYNIIRSLIDPYLLILILMGLILIRISRFRGLKKHQSRWNKCALSLWLILCLLSVPAVGELLKSSLESWVDWRELPANVDVIVVLGGGKIGESLSGDPAMPTEPTLLRCQKALGIHQEFPAATVLVCGGRVFTTDDGASEAEVMKSLLVAYQVPAEQIFKEERSRSTYENAKYAAELIEQNQHENIILVTHGTHLVRATLCFQSQGIEVYPVGADLADLNWYRDNIRLLLPNRAGFDESASVIHELIGLAWYSVSGKFNQPE